MRAGLELGELRFDPGADAVAEFVHSLVGDSVERAGALFAAGDEGLGEQSREVLGEVLLGGAECLSELPDRSLLMGAQVVEGTQPGRI